MMKRKNIVLSIIRALMAITIFSACGSSQVDIDATATQAAATKFAAQTAEASTATPEPMDTPKPTETTVPSRTPSPTLTPSSTATETPSPTATPTALVLETDHGLDLVFSPDGKLLASDGFEGANVFIWDVASGCIVDTLLTTYEHVRGLAFSPDGKYLAVESNPENKIGIWDLEQSRRVNTVFGPFMPGGNFHIVEFSEDGNYITIVSLGGSEVTEIRTGDVVDRVPMQDMITPPMWSLNFSTRGFVFQYGDGYLFIWNVYTGEVTSFEALDGQVEATDISPDGAIVGAGFSSGEYAIRLWDFSSKEEIASFGEKFDVEVVAFSPDRSIIGVGYSDGLVELRDTASGDLLLTFTDHLSSTVQSRISQIVFSTDGNTLAFSGRYGPIYIRNIQYIYSDTITPVPKNTPTATQTSQPVPNVVLEAKETYLQDFISSDWCGGPGMRNGEFTLDMIGNIWVAGGCQGLDGLHVFDGTEWTSHDGSYVDFAHDLEGQIWAISPFSSALDIYDGQQWRTIEGTDLGIGEQQILQVEVDSNGRIWIITSDFGVYEVAEIVLQNGKPTALFSHPEFTISDGYIKSLDADNQGNLWASVFGLGSADERWSSLYVFDGEAWQQFPDLGLDLLNVVRTRYDNMGNLWFATECGGVITYDGTTWTKLAEAVTGNDCSFDDQIFGFTLDGHGRVWTWNFDGIHLLEDGFWIDITLENLGLPDAMIFGLVVDKLDQVWIGTSKGVVMVTLQ